ncbi:MAG: MFS transporter [Proteobacteria bacterium]|nr:MFS transporter [Pseudomonadota bacterium]
MDPSRTPPAARLADEHDATLSASAKRRLLWLIASAFFMQMLDSTIVNTAAPSMASALDVTPLSIKNALISYTLSLAVFIPLSAWLADRFGTRRVFATAVTIFSVGSLACGLATTLPMLVVARIVQGFGGAMLIPVGRLAILRSFSKAEMVGALAFATIPGLIGPTIGPFLGGALSTYLSWRMIFFVNLPLGIAGLWMTQHAMPDYRAMVHTPFDVAGFLLLGTGIGALSWALEQASDARYAPMLAIGLPALALLVIYARRSLRIAHPVVDLRLLRIESFRIGINGNLSTRLGMSGVYFLLTLLLQVGLGYSPLMAGLLQTPQAVSMFATRFFVAWIIRYFGFRRVLIVNTILAGIMILSFAMIDAHTPIWCVCAQVFVYGAIMSIQYAAVNTLGFVDLTADQASMGASMTSTAQYLSISIGVAFGTLLMGAFLHLGRDEGAAYINAFHATMLVLGAVTILSAFVFHRVPRAAGT